MTRHNNTIYHRKPIDERSKGPNFTEIERPQKLSAIRKELKRKIAGCQMQLRHAGPWISEKMLEKTRKDMAKYERQMVNLPAEKTHKIKRTYKKLPLEKIRAYTLSEIDKAKAKDEIYIAADDIAHQLNVKPHFVKQVFQQLNVEGILSQPIHQAPHDSKRDPWCIGGDNGWMANLYRIVYHDDEEDDV